MQILLKKKNSMTNIENIETAGTYIIFYRFEIFSDKIESTYIEK